MRRFASLIGVTLLAVTACAPSQPPAAATPAATEKPVAGGRLVVGVTGEPKTFQPVISTDTTSRTAYEWVYQGLTRTNKDNGDTEGQLAVAAPTISSDGLTLTYTLKDNLVWSDGVPFTGDDYKYTAEAVARSKKTVRKSTLQDIVGWKDYVDGKADTVTGIEVSGGGKTITVKLTKVFCPGVAALGGAGAGAIIPKHSFLQYWDNKSTDITKNIDDNPLNSAPPASMGPFIRVKTDPGQQVTYKRNDKYHRGAPYIEELVIKQYSNSDALKAALLTGEVSYGTVGALDYEEVSKSEILKGYRFPGYGYSYIGWNAAGAKAPWLRSVQVRQALWYGLNVDAIMDKIIFGLGARQLGHLPTPSWAYDPSIYNKYPYDVSKAKQLLEQAGAKMGTDGVYRWTDGKPMQMRIETSSASKTNTTILEVAVEQYKQIGIKIDPLLEAFNVLLDRTDPGTDFEGFIIGWSLGTDPDSYSIWHSSQRGKSQFNDVDYVNPAVDAALEAGRNGPDCSKDARKKQYQIIEKNLNNDAPYTFLYNGDSLLFMNKKIQGVAPTAISTIHNVEQWWLKQ